MHKAHKHEPNSIKNSVLIHKQTITPECHMLLLSGFQHGGRILLHYFLRLNVSWNIYILLFSVINFQ